MGRHLGRRTAVCLLLGLLPAVLGGGVAVASPAVPAAVSSAAGDRQPIQVTLVTGDRVLLGAPMNGKPTATVLPPAGSGTVSYRSYVSGSDLYVVPHSVAGLVPDLLDPGLFDVSALARMGYDDAHAATLPLIVQHAPGARPPAALGNGLRFGRELSSINGFAASLPRAAAAGFGARLAQARVVAPRGHGVAANDLAAVLGGVTHVWLDRPVTAADLDANLTQIGAPAAWQAGLSGAGVKVAVLDTGIDASHPDLQNQVLASASFVGTADAADGNGHGTHVASLIAGTGTAAAGARRGVAYGAQLLVGKVLDDSGRGPESGVIAGMQWAVAQGSQVVNMSLGGAGTADDPLVQAVDDLSAASGALFVVAAGNSGPSSGTIAVPGAAAAALTVGAVTRTDAVTFFSSRGPVANTYQIKPDITAPGVNIVGARAGGGTTNPYTTYSGTSQATPQVAGAAALLRQEHPQWTSKQIKAALVDTAAPSANATVWDQGGGRLDLAHATAAPLLADPATMDFGILRWPDRAPVSRTMTLTNPGDSARTVHLSDAETLAGTVAVPDAMVTITPSDLTIPAHGTGAVTVVLTPALGDTGLYSGAVTVSDGSTPLIHLPVGFYEEPERYDLHLTVLDHDGNPYAAGTVTAVNLDDMAAGLYEDVALDDKGQATIRVAPGSYGILAQVTTPAPDGGPASLALPIVPDVDVHHDTSVTLDARKTVVLRAPAVAGVQTHPVMANLAVTFTDPQRRGLSTLAFPDAADVAAGRVFIQPVTPATPGRFMFTARFRLAADFPSGAERIPQVYDLFFEHPYVPATPVSDLSRADVGRLARLDTRYNGLRAPATVTEMRVGWTDTTGIALGYPQPLSVPTRRTEYVTADPTVHWYQRLTLPGSEDLDPYGPVRSYQPGEQDEVHWLRTLSSQPIGVYRDPDMLTVILGIGDGEHAAQMFSALRSAHMSVSRDGQPLGERDDVFGYFAIPTGPGRFTVAEDLKIDTAVIPGPSATHTTWSFLALPPANPDTAPDAVPPVLTLEYAPDVDSLGQARPWQPLRLDLNVRHLDGASNPVPAVQDATLAYSVDGGTTWLPLHVNRYLDGLFRATIPGWAMRPGGLISLHATARDVDGGTVDQTVVDMVRVNNLP
jgi:subtilisin family serine protease